MQPTDATLLELAFRTLEVVLAQAHAGPVPKAWGTRLALAVVARSGATLDWHCQSFWDTMADPRLSQAAGSAEYERVTKLTGLLNHWYMALGRPIPDEMQREQFRRRLPAS